MSHRTRVADVSVTTAQRQTACERLVQALRKGQLGRVMLDGVPPAAGQQRA